MARVRYIKQYATVVLVEFVSIYLSPLKIDGNKMIKKWISMQAVSVAYERELTTEQKDDLSRILEEQPTVVYNALRSIVGSDGQIEVLISFLEF